MRYEVDINGKITEHEDAPAIERTIEEILNQQTQEATQYLKDTDWVNDYKTRHDLGLELIPEDSLKWVIINKRAECIEYLRGVK